jgi:LacI family transcriptional regulator
VFCANDRLALGTARALHARGLRIPQDVAVAGMDDSVLARSVWPPLTSVDLGSTERGRRAAELLVERLDGTAPIPRGTTATAPPRLVVRASTAPPTENTRST